jgi:hypothetical protein
VYITQLFWGADAVSGVSVMVSTVAADAAELTRAGTPAPIVAATTPATPRRLNALEVRDMHCPFMTVTER